MGIQGEGRRRADAPLKVWLVDRAGHELGGMKAGRSGQEGEASAHATPKATHTTPSRARYSAGSRPGSSGKKWAVTLDLPETVPARQSPLTNGVVGTAGDGRGVSASPLPLVSPDTAMTKKGESLVSQLDLGN